MVATRPGPVAAERPRPWLRLLHLAALLVGVGYGVHHPVMVLLGRTGLPTNDISQLEGVFAQVRAGVPAGRTLGWLTPAGAGGGVERLAVVAQYALTPVPLRRVAMAECLAKGPAACGLDDLDLVLAIYLPPDPALFRRVGITMPPDVKPGQIVPVRRGAW